MTDYPCTGGSAVPSVATVISMTPGQREVLELDACPPHLCIANRLRLWTSTATPPHRPALWAASTFPGNPCFAAPP